MHRYEWHEIYDILTINGRRVHAKNLNGEILEEEEILRRLNEWEDLQKCKRATEALSAEEALDWVNLGFNHALKTQLREYARILGGQDENK